jgi:hypothetical protein
MRSDFSYFSRIGRQYSHRTGSAYLMAAKESTASVETRSSGSSATRGSSSRRKSRASSAATLRGGGGPSFIGSQSRATSFFHLRRLHRRQSVCKLDSSVFPPLLTGMM